MDGTNKERVHKQSAAEKASGKSRCWAELVTRPLRLPAAFTGNRKVLVLGMGGGCDVITAYVVAQRLPGLSQNVGWGNVKRCTDELSPLTPDGRIATISEFVPIEANKNYYGTSGIDAGTPQGPHSSPLIVRIPRASSYPDEGKVPESELAAVATALTSLGFDAVVGVDAGGDSVTGGIDHSGDPSTGVDQMMLRVLDYTGLPFLHVVCGFGCDGESSIEQIEACMEELKPTYVGACDMCRWAVEFERLAGVLGPTRTPAIMAAAGKAVDAAGGLDAAIASGQVMVVDRGIRPEIPIAMLAVAFSFLRHQ